METESQILERALKENAFSRADADRLRTLLNSIELAPWFETVDDSAYALGDWLRGLRAFDAWLAERHVSERPVDTMLGYLECCTMTVPETLAPPDFPDLVRGNLDAHGFDAARPAKA